MAWKALLVEIGKGILSGAGSKIFSDFFGGRQVDFTAILNKALTEFSDELEKKFKAELDRRQVESALLYLRSAQRNARLYNLAPDERNDTLDEITVDLSDCVATLDALDERALGAYTIAVALEISIVQERAKLNGKEELNAVCLILREAIANLKQSMTKIKADSDARFSGVSYNGIPTPGSLGEPSFWNVYYRFNGKVVYELSTPNDTFHGERGREVSAAVRQKMEEHMQQEWERIRSRLLPINQLIRDLVEWAKELDIECSSDLPVMLEAKLQEVE